MPMPIRYNVGDKVIITADNLKIMQDSNRSTLHPLFPSDSFIEKARKCVAPDGHVGLIGGLLTHFLRDTKSPRGLKTILPST